MNKNYQSVSGYLLASSSESREREIQYLQKASKGQKAPFVIFPHSFWFGNQKKKKNYKYIYKNWPKQGSFVLTYTFQLISIQKKIVSQKSKQYWYFSNIIIHKK